MRTECTDHLIITRRAQERTMGRFVRHYNQARPHRGLDLSTPQARPPARQCGEVVRTDVLGGLIHEYVRAAA